MANEVMQSLFGLDSASTAEALRQRQAAEDLAFARLSPKQQVVYGMAQAGREAGAGLNQLFGYTSPELQRVRSQEEALMEVQQSGISLNDPEAMYPALAKALASRGLQQQAMMVAMHGHSAIDEARKQKAALAKAQREAKEPQGTEGERAARTLAAAEAFVRGGGQLSLADTSYAMSLYNTAGKSKYHTVINPATNQVVTAAVPDSAAPVAQLYPGLTRLFTVQYGSAVPEAGVSVADSTTLPADTSDAAKIFKAPPGFDITGNTLPLPPVAPPVTPQWKPQQGPALSTPPVTASSGVTVTPLPQSPQQLKQEAFEERRTTAAEGTLKLAQEKHSEETKEKRGKKLQQLDNAIANTDIAISAAMEAKGKVDWTTPFLSWVPMTEAHDISKSVKTVLARLSLDELAKLKQASDTGGALGQIAVAELDILQKSVAALDLTQKPATLRANLGKVIAQYAKYREAALKARAEITGMPVGKPKKWNPKTKQWE